MSAAVRRSPAVLVALAGLSIAASAVFSGCTAANPTTGRRQLSVASLDRDEQIQIGTEQKPEMEKEFGGVVSDQQAQAYVVNIGKRLAETTRQDDPKMADLPWEFTLLNSDVVNAFALPGGKVFVSKGLAVKMTNEAQMAAVLGHEIGHVTAEHTSERYGQQLMVVGGSAIAGAVLGAVIDSDNRATGAGIGAGVGAAAGGIATLSYSRNQEIEADRLGMRYMERLKYNPQGAIQVQEILQREAGSGQTLEIMSTHPSSETRINELNKRMQKYYQHTVNNPEYQFYEDRFRSQFLSRFAAADVSAPAHSMMLAAAAATTGGIDLNRPETWCAHCAAAAQH